MTTGVEMWVKVFSPNVISIEVVKRAERRIRRARLYYMRFVKKSRTILCSYTCLLLYFRKPRRKEKLELVLLRDDKWTLALTNIF